MGTPKQGTSRIWQECNRNMPAVPDILMIFLLKSWASLLLGPRSSVFISGGLLAAHHPTTRLVCVQRRATQNGLIFNYKVQYPIQESPSCGSSCSGPQVPASSSGSSQVFSVEVAKHCFRSYPIFSKRRLKLKESPSNRTVLHEAFQARLQRTHFQARWSFGGV